MNASKRATSVVEANINNKFDIDNDTPSKNDNNRIEIKAEITNPSVPSTDFFVPSHLCFPK